MEVDYFSSIPPEIIEIILSDRGIKFKDISSFCLTCRYFNEVVTLRSSLWKRKLFSIWPFMKNPYRNKKIDNWMHQVKHIVETKRYCKTEIKLMSYKFRWRRQNISFSDLHHFLDKCRENEGLAFYYISKYLKDIIESGVDIYEGTPPPDAFTLTDQHYAKHVYVYIFQNHLKDKWFELVQHETSFVPDKVATFAIQWLFPRNDNSSRTFSQYVDILVKKMESKMLQDHPLLRVDKDERDNWAHNLLEDNQLSGTVCKSMFHLLSTIIFGEDQFHIRESPAIQMLNIHDMMVYQNSHKYLSYILYESVARRCGIRCDITGSGNHLFLYWRENWSEGSPKYMVNVLDGAMKLSLGRCPYALPSNSSPSPEEDKEYSAALLLSTLVPEVNNVIQAFELSIVTYTLELLYAILPQDIDNLKFIAYLYVLQKKDLRLIINHITQQLAEGDLSAHNRQELTLLLENALKEQRKNQGNEMQKINVKPRTPNVLFAIGMVCHHKLYQYKCMITGWDFSCRASTEWQRNMGVFRLKDGADQPFYHALAEDGSQRYVAQENLEFIRGPCRLLNVEEKIAVDFSHFNGFQYIPNNEKKVEYPDDLVFSEYFQHRIVRPYEHMDCRRSQPPFHG